MPSLIDQLPDPLQLLDDLNYLNMEEIKGFCRKHAIPYSIWMETASGQRRKTAENDRKGVVLARVRHYLQTGVIGDPTCFPAAVVSIEPVPEKLHETDRLRYGHYSRSNPAVMTLLQQLTGGEFEDGAVARILVNEFWRQGRAPTYGEFAAAWLEARRNHAHPRPEWAFLSDRADRKDIPDWKQYRHEKARQVLAVLDGIAAPSRQAD